MNRFFITLLALGCLWGALNIPAFAQNEFAAGATPKPFRVPFRGPPGPTTWLMGQAYGNTTGAYRQRKTTYVAGQGIHFGVDFASPCKSELVAIGDGVVSEVDNLQYGSAPHNLILRFPNGYAALYGHLYERPRVLVGQQVKAGQVVALSGDPDETCRSRPHLHLEIRDSTYARAFNPIQLIDADWDSFALVAPFGRGFEKDLDEPRKWQHLDDQPTITFGLPLINDFARAFPFSLGIDR